MRRTCFTVWLNAACAVVFSSTTSAQEGGNAGRFYIGGGTGLAMPRDITVEDRTAGTPIRAKTRFEPGPRLDVSVGYNFTEHWAAEFETGLIFNSSKGSQTLSLTSGDQFWFQVPLLANLAYKIPTRVPLKPFIGAGVGGIYTTVQRDDHIAFFGHSVDHDLVFAYQASGGLRYQIGEKAELGLAYKFTGTLDHNFDRISTTTSGNLIHSLLLSFTFRF